MLDSKEIDHIIIVFENCESVSLAANNINALKIDGVKEKWQVHFPHNADVEVETMWKDYTCEKFNIEIDKKANVLGNMQTFVKDDVILPFDRIKSYKDITDIEINYTDGTWDYVILPWGGVDGNETAEENDFQICNNYVDEFTDSSGISVTVEAPCSWRSKY